MLEKKMEASTVHRTSSTGCIRPAGRGSVDTCAQKTWPRLARSILTTLRHNSQSQLTKRKKYGGKSVWVNHSRWSIEEAQGSGGSVGGWGENLIPRQFTFPKKKRLTDAQIIMNLEKLGPYSDSRQNRLFWFTNYFFWRAKTIWTVQKR